MPLDMRRNLKFVTSFSYRSAFQSLFNLFSTGSDLAKHAAIIYGHSIGDGLAHQPLAEVVYNTGNYSMLIIQSLEALERRYIPSAISGMFMSVAC